MPTLLMHIVFPVVGELALMFSFIFEIITLAVNMFV